MAVDVETLVVRLEAKVSDFERSMARAQRSATTASTKIGAAFSGLNKTIGKGLALVGISLGVRALTGFITEAAKAGEAIGDAAEKMRISAESFQELKFAADQSGTSIETLETAFKGMVKLLGEVERGSKSAKAELANIGISLEDLNGLSRDQAFELFVDRIGKLPTELQRDAASLKFFGKSAQDMAGFVDLGSKGIDQLRARARALGIVLSDETIKKSQDAADAIAEIAAAFEAGKINLGAGLLGAIESLRDFVTSDAFQKGLKSTADEISRIVGFFDSLTKDKGLETAGVNVNIPQSVIELSRRLQEPSEADRAAAAKNAALSRELAANRPATPAVKPAAATTPAGTGFGGGNDAQDKIDDVTAALKFESAQLQRTARDQEIFNELNKAGVSITSAAGQEIARLAGEHFDLQASLKNTIEQMDNLRDVASDVLSGFIDDLREGKSAAEALGNVFDKLADKLVEIAVQQLILSAFGAPGTGAGGFLGSLFGGARQAGGPVTAGKGFLVGEKGPELFVPNVSGRIVPSGGSSERHTVELVLSEEIDARIKRVSGPQSERISFNIVRANNALTARSRELQG